MIQQLTNLITAVFLLIILSYYVLLIVKRKTTLAGKASKSITVIVPAHNEQKYIADCLQSILDASFVGRKDIIVIDDGSKDKTFQIAKNFNVKVIRSSHEGKSASINKALKLSRSELVAIVDADSVISKESLMEAERLLRDRKVGAVCSVIKVKNRNTFLGMWLHIEQLYNSLLRSLFTKVNVNIVTPGPLSVYRRAYLSEIGGFETKGLSEDVDVAIRLIKSGHRIEMSEQSVASTNMPVSMKGFARQRTRFARGWINIFKRHLRLSSSLRLYTLPLAFFNYFQAVVMGTITIVNITSGYVQYFVSKGEYLSLNVGLFLLDWLSATGTIKWTWRIIAGLEPLTAFTIIGLCATLLSYPLFVLAILRYDRKLDWRHAVPLFFMFPFWLLVMVFYIANLWEIFNPKQHNIWHK